MKQPWGKFFWNDWQGDPCLRVCSLAAQGLWMRMLCLAAEATPVGYVTLAGRPCTATDLSRLTGESEETITGLMDELERYGVFSRTRTGTVYNRRMVRDAKKRKTAQQNGKKGGNPSLCSKDDIPPLDNQTDKGEDKTQKPEARSQRPEKDAVVVGARDPFHDVGEQVLALCGSSPNLTHYSRVRTWLDQGCDPELDIYPTVRRLMASRNGQAPNTLNYFDQAIADAKARRTKPLPEGKADDFKISRIPERPRGAADTALAGLARSSGG